MRVIIVGCGRVGARVAAALDERGENVTVIDASARAFARLPQTFKGETVRGNGTDEDVMRSAGAEQADIVMTLTEGDNRNALAAQLAKHRFGVPRVIAKINDPLRGEAYRALGLETICRTIILGDALVTAAVDGAAATNGFVEEPTAQPLRGAPPPGSLADRNAKEALASEDGEEKAEANVIQPSDGREGGF
jgi:trk system potassium uptake protein TrkA